MAAMSVVSYTSRPNIHCVFRRLLQQPCARLHHLRPASLTLRPLEATVLFRHIFKAARRLSVILLPSTSTSCTVLDILCFYAQRTLGRPPFLSPLCGIWKHGVGKTKRSSIGRRRSSCTLLRKHTFCWIAGCGAKDFYSLHISARNTCSLS
jgi:hypothetical protein